MNPVLSVGDVVVTSPARADEAVVGRIALIERPGDASTTMHRIVGGSALTGYTSRGDANAVPDVGTVSAQEVHGLLRLRIPWFGFPALWWHEGRYARILALGCLLAATAELLTRRGPRAGATSPTLVLVPAGMVSIAAVLGVGYATAAATTPSTVNAGNTFTSATVSLTGSTGTSLWSSAAIAEAQPGSRGEACITVTYSGSVAADVQLAPAGTSSPADAYVRLSIERGTTPATTSCEGFGGTVTALYNRNDDDTATLATFRTDAANGVDTWTASAAGDFAVYRVRWTYLDDDVAAGTSFSVGLQWSAVST